MNDVTIKKISETIYGFTSIGRVSKYYKGLMCGCIPIPGRKNKKQGKEPATVKTQEVVVTSPNVVETLKYLSQVWQDKFAESVLISAPPGTGKENFSKSIPYGTGRLGIADDVSKYTISFADFIDRQGELADKLFGKANRNGKIVDSLIIQSKGKVLFLDEVHHPETIPGIRASFLRLLDPGYFEPKKAKKPEEVRDVLFVLATSKTLKTTKRGQKGLDKIPPPDFWTRMTHVVTVKHPFEGVWGEVFPDIIDNYFIFFWFDRLEKYFKIDPETEENLDPKSTIREFKYIHRLNQMKKLKNESKNGKLKLKMLAEKFRERLTLILREERIQPHELSIRGFKNIVTRLFSISAESVAQGYDFDPEKIEKHIDPVIYEILEIAKLDV